MILINSCPYFHENAEALSVFREKFFFNLSYEGKEQERIKFTLRFSYFYILTQPAWPHERDQSIIKVQRFHEVWSSSNDSQLPSLKQNSINR